MAKGLLSRNSLGSFLCLSIKPVHATLHKDLNLFKISDRWVPKLVDEEMKKERVRTLSE
jgi:hypothetical protein